MVHGFLRSAALWFAASVVASAATAQPAQKPNDAAAQPPRVSAVIAPPAQTTSDPTTQIFLPKLSPGMTLSRYLEILRQDFRRLDADRDNELTAADADLHEIAVRAMVRALIAMTILRADLDGDGYVTQAELRKTLRYDERSDGATPQSLDTIEVAVRQLMAADTDGDGRISVAEALSFAANPKDSLPKMVTSLGGAAQRMNLLLANWNSAANQRNPMADEVRRLLPVGHDGKVTMADFDAAATAVFRAVDTDGNGTISQDELNGYRKREADAARERQEAATRAECTMPKASDTATVAVLSAYKSEAISTVGLGSQDVATGTGEIRIEAGEGPLYIVAISHEPTIWRVTGATDRVERLVAFGVTAQSNHITIAANPVPVSAPAASQPNVTPRPVTPQQPVALAGISGLPADRVSFLARANCLRSFTEAKSTDGAFVLAAVRRDTGKEPSMVAARQNAAAFSVPSGQIRSAYEDKKQPRLTIVKEAGVLTLKGDSSGVVVRTGPTDLESDLEQFSPGGVINIDPQTVVANAPAVRYEVLPGAAGLLQLENSGALTRNQRGEFLIHRKIRFPAGLAPLSPTFLLLRGVEMPEGHPDGAKVISEETGQQIKF